MGVDRWDRRAGGLRVTCSSCPPLFASGSFSRRHPVCSPRLAERVADAGSRLLPAGPVACVSCHSRACAPPSADSIMLSSALPPAALTMPQLSAVLTPKAEVPACVSSVT